MYNFYIDKKNKSFDLSKTKQCHLDGVTPTSFYTDPQPLGDHYTKSGDSSSQPFPSTSLTLFLLQMNH